MTTTPAFQRTLDTLNPAQREAVEGIHGPWIVLAGPGTGKTHMLAARIGNILLHGHAEPRNILCLTFTTAGVKAMRDRLVQFLGAPGSRVAVNTFHGFARQVIADHPAVFDYTDWQEMDELDSRRLVNELIGQLPPKHLLRGPRHEPYRFGKDLLWLFNQMAQESWSPEDVAAAANHHVLDLPNIPAYVYKRKTGDKMPGDLNPQAREREQKMIFLAAGAQLFHDYAKLKRRRGLYDYADQVSWLRDALRDHDSLRLQLMEQYQYLMVDEYQDTNGLQNDIIALLAEDDNPNLFVVGDDDQSIFGFQGARIQGLRELAARYVPDIRAVVLRENYRSHAGILEAAETLIKANQNRLLDIGGLRLDKSLAEAAAGFAERPLPEVVRYPNAWAQAVDVARDIKAWLAAGTPPEEVGVIYRKHAQAARLIDALEIAGVPYRLERSINVLEQPLVRRLHAALKFIGNLRDDRPVDNQLAFEFLLSPAIGLTPTDLFSVNNYRFTDRRRADSWRYLLTHPGVLETDEVPLAHPERFRRAHELLNELGALGDRHPLPTVVRQVVQRTGLLREALSGDEADLALEALDTLVRDAQARLAKKPDLTLGELCATWDELIEYDMPVRLVKQADTRPAVSLMTAHKAKGLEFERVVMYDVTRRAWDSNRKHNSAFAMPPELSFEADKSAKEEENRRLFYVALTRAKHYVRLCVPAESDSGAGESASVAVDELLTEGLATEREADVDPDLLRDQLEAHYSQALQPVAPLLHPASAKTRWAEEDLTLGAATQFGRCRVGFYYQYVSNVSPTADATTRYRRVVHETLKEYYRQALHPEALEFGSVEELVALYAGKLARERAALTEREYADFAADGEAVLRTWFDAPDDPASLNTVIERTIATTNGLGLRLRGTVDRIDVDPASTLGIPVEYKFGAPRAIKYGVSSRNKRDDRRPRELDNRLWRQLAYYALLMRDGFNKGVLPRRARVVYLDPRGTQVVEVDLPEASVARLEEELYDTYHAIVDCDDFSGCHEDPATSDRDKMNCPWCAFHYLKRDSAVLMSEEVAELDDA